MTLRFHTFLPATIEIPILVTAIIHQSRSEPGSPSVPDSTYIDSLSVHDPRTDRPLHGILTQEQFEAVYTEAERLAGIRV